jgi:dihydroorotase-like cyclic amidohydrolase
MAIFAIDGVNACMIWLLPARGDADLHSSKTAGSPSLAGIIEAVGTGRTCQRRGKPKITARRWILPGAVDGQTHAGSQIGFAGIGPTSHAAVMGGVTTIVDMPYDHPIPVTTWRRAGRKGCGHRQRSLCDVALYGTVPTTPNLTHVQELIDGGVCAFKISSFEAHPDRFPRIGNAATLQLLTVAGGHRVCRWACTMKTRRSSPSHQNASSPRARPG